MEHLFDQGVTVKKFTHFVAPSVVMLLFISFYYIVDSIFVANFVGMNALAAMSIVYPIQGLMWGVAVMLAAGSSAIVAIRMGEGKQQEANEKFSLILLVSLVAGLISIALGLIFVVDICNFLGATDLLRGYCVDFLSVLVLATPAAFLGVLFEYFIRVDGRPGFTLLLYVAGGVVHIGLDYVFIVLMDMGIKGAAWASFGGLSTTFLMGLIYFLVCETKLKLVKANWDGRYLGHTLLNGSSEMATECSAGIMTFVFNLIVLRLAGEDGVSAVSIVLNVHYLMISVHLGYITGVSPLISYYYGAADYTKVKVFLKYSKIFILVSSVVVAVLCFFEAPLFARIYETPGTPVFEMAEVGIRYLSIALLFTGINIFASGFFTAYGNGQISALISLSRSLFMVSLGAFALSALLGLTGVWLSLAFAEITTLGLTFYMLRRYRGIYHY